MAFASDIFISKRLIYSFLVSSGLFWYVNFLIVDSDDNNLCFGFTILQLDFGLATSVTRLQFVF